MNDGTGVTYLSVDTFFFFSGEERHCLRHEGSGAQGKGSVLPRDTFFFFFFSGFLAFYSMLTSVTQFPKKNAIWAADPLPGCLSRYGPPSSTLVMLMWPLPSLNGVLCSAAHRLPPFLAKPIGVLKNGLKYTYAVMLHRCVPSLETSRTSERRSNSPGPFRRWPQVLRRQAFSPREPHVCLAPCVCVSATLCQVHPSDADVPLHPDGLYLHIPGPRQRRRQQGPTDPLIAQFCVGNNQLGMRVATRSTQLSRHC